VVEAEAKTRWDMNEGLVHFMFPNYYADVWDKSRTKSYFVIFLSTIWVCSLVFAGLRQGLIPGVPPVKRLIGRGVAAPRRQDGCFNAGCAPPAALPQRVTTTPDRAWLAANV
jgi:hypothetical protein